MAKAQIQIHTAEHYSLKVRGHQMELERADGGWVMRTQNAATRGWFGQSFGSYKRFATLQDVEAAYKSWAGIHQLASEQLAKAEIARIAVLPAVGI